MAGSSTRVLDFDAALQCVLEHAAIRRDNRGVPVAETVPLLDAAGRILAAPVFAERDQPPFDRATRDGFAVRAVEFSSGVQLRTIGQVRAGERWSGPAMNAGEAIEIMTGAPVPAGADSVAMIEHFEVEESTVQAAARRTLQAGENIVLRGREARAGDTLLPTGTSIAAAEIALAAACGLPTLEVFSRPMVAIVATGDELVELDQSPDAEQIRNSNSYGIASLVTAAGGFPGRLKIARDLREEIRERIWQGRMWDLLIFSGGVSMGKFDLVEEVLAEFGAEFFFTGVRMQPGKPVVFGRLPKIECRDGAGPECYFFGLPGNPVSTQVTFHCFVEPFLRTIAGSSETAPNFVQASLAEDVPGKSGLTRVLPARLTRALHRPSVRLVGWQGSGDLAANARANCYAVFPPDSLDLHAGEVITVLLR
jgi:molybdopterin molybdotransferase